MKNNFFVYYYVCPKGLPYYVGKGTGNRATARHLYVGVPPRDRIRFLITNTTEDWALYKEASFIARWGLLHDGTGTLENTCDKPHPTRTGAHSEETRRKISKAQKGVPRGTPWNKGVRGYSTTWKGRTHTKQTKDKLSRLAKARPGTHTTPHTEESKELMRRNHPGCRPVVVGGVPYRSVSEAARRLGVSNATIRNRINKV